MFYASKEVFLLCLLMLDVFISVYVFVYTQTLADVDELSLKIPRHLSELVGSL